MNLLPAAHNVDDEVREIPIPVLVLMHWNRSTVLGTDPIPLDPVCFIILKKTDVFPEPYFLPFTTELMV
jgi:hypothetical protein